MMFINEIPQLLILKSNLIDIRIRGMSTNETILHPSHNLEKLIIIGQSMVFNA